MNTQSCVLLLNFPQTVITVKKRMFASHLLDQDGVLLHIKIQSGDWHGWCSVDIMKQ